MRIRYYLLTKRDKKGRICLHYACKNGSKDFTTMIVYEARQLDFLDEIRNAEDKYGLTPLYVLCEDGFKKQYQDNEVDLVLKEEIEALEAFDNLDKNKDG